MPGGTRYKTTKTILKRRKKAALGDWVSWHRRFLLHLPRQQLAVGSLLSLADLRSAPPQSAPRLHSNTTTRKPTRFSVFGSSTHRGLATASTTGIRSSPLRITFRIAGASYSSASSRRRRNETKERNVAVGAVGSRGDRVIRRNHSSVVDGAVKGHLLRCRVVKADRFGVSMMLSMMQSIGQARVR